MKKRPNIVLILNDDMGFSDIGCYGGEVDTPNLNRLASQGLRFTQFYNTARCCPSRASLLTGLHPHQAGVGHMVDLATDVDEYIGDLSSNAITIAQALKSVDYGTYMSGKWHVTAYADADDPKHNWPCQRGFDQFFGTITGAANYFFPDAITRNNDKVPDLATDFYFTDAISDNSVAFINQHCKKDDDKPFFLYTAYTAPHWPLQAKDRDINKYKGKFDKGWDQLRQERLARMVEMGIIDAKWKLSERDPHVAAWDETDNKAWQTRRMEVYAAQIDCMDQGIGRIIDSLAQNNQLENTVIIFLADNGGCAEEITSGWSEWCLRCFGDTTRDGRPIKAGNVPGNMPGGEDTFQSYGLPWANLSNTPFRLYKHWVHEGGIATPLIVHWPAGIEAQGALKNVPAQLPDIMASCLELAGADYPTTFDGNAITALEGFSLVPSFNDGEFDREVLCWEHEGNCAARKGRWKIVRRYPGTWELYDMDSDRTEINNLSDQEPKILADLIELYQAWTKRCGVLPWDHVQALMQNNGDAKMLHKLFDTAWEYCISHNPMMATNCGDKRFNHLLNDVSIEAAEKDHQKNLDFLKMLAKIKRDELPIEDQLNYDIFKLNLENRVRAFEFKPYFQGFNKKGGFYQELTYLPDSITFNNAKDFEDYTARLNCVGDCFDTHIKNIRAGLKVGYCEPSVLLEGLEETIAVIIKDDACESLFYQPFIKMPAVISQKKQDQLRTKAQVAIANSVNPAYQRLIDFAKNEYIPMGRDSIAITEIPNGKAYYEYLVWFFTSLDVTPQEIFDVGIQEVTKIKAEMEALAKKAGFGGKLKEFINFLRTDKQFYTDSPEQLLKEATYITKKMDGELPTLFGKLPRTPYGVKPIPDYIAPYSVPGYYSLPPGDLSKAGFLCLNTYKAAERPLYQLEALALHEAVPGHHLQFALQLEMQDIPNFRKFGADTAYCEGWALYSEALGKEVGFYQSDYSEFGRLTFRMWRACRLVVDPGMHYFGWTRQQAIEFMQDNTALSLLNIVNEIDRYINVPGQAVSYMMGELEMWKFRQQAEKSLGENFDIRAYHDLILESGAIPLNILKQKINSWLAN